MQAAVVEHLESAFPGLLFTHIPARSKDGTDGFFKAKMGLRKGAPDLVFWFDGKSAGIELKTSQGKLESAQNKFLSSMRWNGAFTAVCRSVREVHEHLIKWGLTPVHHACKEPDYRTWDEKVGGAIDYFAPPKP